MMLGTAWKWARRRPLFGVAASLTLHLLLVAALLWHGGPSSVPTVKRGEPLFVELPQADDLAQRGAPASPAPAPATPKARPSPPAPQVGAPPPKPAPRPSRPETRTPERPSVASKPAPAPIPEATTPEAEAPRAATAPKTEEAPPSEPARAAPESPPREAPPASPAPRVAAVPEQPQPLPDIRSALRRDGPGTGGAGGSGKAWAGIEGEPIPLDSTDAKFNDYLDRVRRMIKEKWGYPCIKDLATGNCDYKSARLVIVFGILKDGRVPVLEVAQQSGYGVYDDYAVNAIKLAAPFPPVPPSLMATAKSGSSGVKIVAAFQYVLYESSLTNILR